MLCIAIFFYVVEVFRETEKIEKSAYIDIIVKNTKKTQILLLYMTEEEEDSILVEDLKSRSLGKPILYKSRWHMLTIYSLLAAVNQIVWVCFVVRFNF